MKIWGIYIIATVQDLQKQLHRLHYFLAIQAKQNNIYTFFAFNTVYVVVKFLKYKSTKL